MFQAVENYFCLLIHIRLYSNKNILIYLPIYVPSKMFRDHEAKRKICQESFDDYRQKGSVAECSRDL